MLGALDQIPLDTLVIDRTFMREEDPSAKQAIVNAIVHMARELQLKLVVEGVGSTEQDKLFQASGWTVVRENDGAPMDSAEMRDWLVRYHQL